MNGKLSKKQKKDLRREHKQTRERRPADRIKAILLLDDGWTYEEIAEVLLLDEETIRRWEKRYQEGGVKQLQQDNYQGSEGKLTASQEQELKNHLERNLYQSTKEIIVHVADTFGVSFSLSGSKFSITPGEILLGQGHGQGGSCPDLLRTYPFSS